MKPWEYPHPIRQAVLWTVAIHIANGFRLSLCISSKRPISKPKLSEILLALQVSVFVSSLGQCGALLTY